MDSLIPINCRTNLDDYQREYWPVEMVARPIVGDRVESVSGKVLKIVSITHAVIEGRALSSVDRVLHPILKIELG